MGYLQERHGMMMLPAQPREGQCPECGIFHDPDQPHNRDSMLYQYRFYDEHGRWPTWVDAMAHCKDDVKALWVDALKAQGVDIEGQIGTATATVTVSFADPEGEGTNDGER